MGRTNEGCETLFLLEVSVNKLSMSYPRRDLDQEMLSKTADTCVMFQFLHYPPLVVCDNDTVGSVSGGADGVTFGCGKSCFFSVRTPREDVLSVPFEVAVTVISRMKEGVHPDKLEIGSASIRMNDEFTELVKGSACASCDALPLSKSKQGVFHFHDSQGTTVGTLDALLHLSCFGKQIVTQFSLNTGEKSYLFKRTDVSNCGPDVKSPLTNVGKAPMFQQPISLCKDTSKIDPRTPCQEPLIDKNSYEPDHRGKIYSMCSSRVEILLPGESPWSPCSPQGLQPQETLYNCDPMAFTYSPPYPQPYPGGRQLCECPYPAPPGTTPKVTQRSHRTNLNPGEVCIEDDRVVFQLPPENPGDPWTQQDKLTNSSACYRFTSVVTTKDGPEKSTTYVTQEDLRARRGKGGNGEEGLEDVIFMVKVDKCNAFKRKYPGEMSKMEEPKTDQSTQYQEADQPKVEGQPTEEGMQTKKGKDKEKKAKNKKKK